MKEKHLNLKSYLLNFFNISLLIITNILLLTLLPFALTYRWKTQKLNVYLRRKRVEIEVRVADDVIGKSIGFMFSNDKRPILFKAPCCLWSANISFPIYVYKIKDKKLVGFEILNPYTLKSKCFYNCDHVIESRYKLFNIK
jgi:uncharacterized membrane protein (UPF0127 family)